jgi:hypothetical protein
MVTVAVSMASPLWLEETEGAPVGAAPRISFAEVNLGRISPP